MGAPKLKYDIPEEKSIGDIVKLFPSDNSSEEPRSKRKANIPHRAECIQSLDDIRKIQNYFISKKDYRDYMMFTLGICTGLRVSDLCALDVSDVLNEDLSFKEYIDIKEKKTGKRTVNLDDKCLITEAARDAISVYLKHSCRSYFDPLIYSKKPNSNGEHRLAEESAWRVLKVAQRDLEITYNIGSHSMRKTFANIAACTGEQSNIDMNKLLQIQHMLRHGDYRTTMRYLNLNSVFTANARQNVSDFVLGKTKYNNLNDALMSPNNDSDKLNKILESLNSLIDLSGG